jgi:DNA polymerase/3'-5' exonuclease PolX
MTKIPVMLAKEYQKGMSGNKKDASEFKDPPIGWYQSEKFDGYRALFKYDEDGKGCFYSRAGKIFRCPKWFLDSLPPYNILGDNILDGELWAGRDNFQMMGTVRKKEPIDEEWMDIQYQVYDVVTSCETLFKDRIKIMKKIISFTKNRWWILKKDGTIPYPMNNVDCPVHMTKQTKVTSYKQMDRYYKEIIKEGGEGIMLKHPLTSYIDGRNSYLLKYKPSFDREAIITGYKEGNGKYKGMLGGLICKPLINHDTYMTIDKDEDHVFTLSGMDDAIRKNYKKTHPLGTIISFECSGYTEKGVPRFGRYIRSRDDVILKEANLDSNEKLKQVLEIFSKLEKYYRENQDTFRAKSYSTGLKSLKSLENDSQLNEKTFSTMKGIGKGLQEKIRQIIDTGTCLDYDKIKDKKSPKSLFLQIHGVGPQCANKMIQGGLETIEDVQKNQDIYLNDVQKKGLKWFDDIQERIPYQEIQKHEIFLKKTLQEINPNAELTIAGSYRRKKSDSGDIDLLVKADSRKVYDEYIDSLIKKGYLRDTLARGNKKFMGMGTIDISKKKNKCRRIDIMYAKPEEYPFAILYFTGSGDFNQRMRNELLEKGYTMNEYGVKYIETKKKVEHLFTTEKDIFEYFGYEYLEPEDRVE